MHYCNRGKNVFTIYFLNQKHIPSFLKQYGSFLSVFFRYNELNILFDFGFPVECLQALRDWDYLCASCCS